MTNHGRDPEEEVPLLPIDEYKDRILGGVASLDPRSLPLADAHGCVLAADVIAPADLPPFESSAMDGFAVRSSDIAGGGGDLRIAGRVAMGAPTALRVGELEAVAISTGAVVPDGADVVVPIELCDLDGDRVRVLRTLPSGKHVRAAGEDVRAGDVLVPAGRRLRAPDLGALAASGLSSVDVYPPALVGIVSTGDELVRPGRPLGEGQIYDSNSFTLAAALREAGAQPIDGGPASDAPGALTKVLDALDVDAFVCSGGVSMGEHDPVKRAFEGSGDVEFFNVAMQPGRPQAFGSFRGRPFFGLPGNPISVYVSFEVFVRPALMKMMGRTDERPTVEAVLEGDIEAPKTRARYARVRVRRDGDRYVATPEGGHQSNLLVTFARADGLVKIDAGRSLRSGDRCKVTLIRDV